MAPTPIATITYPQKGFAMATYKPRIPSAPPTAKMESDSLIDLNTFFPYLMCVCYYTI